MHAERVCVDTVWIIVHMLLAPLISNKSVHVEVAPKATFCIFTLPACIFIPSIMVMAIVKNVKSFANKDPLALLTFKAV